MKNTLLILCLFFFCAEKSFAGQNNIKDSLRIETINGKKYIIYRVLSNESYAGLAKRYNVLENHIRESNPNHKPNLRKGNIIKIPYGLNSDKIVEEQIKSESISAISEPVKPEQIIKENEIKQRKAVLYGEEIKTVLNNGKKEVIYEASEEDNLDEIALNYNTTSQDIVARNNLRKTKLYELQRLIIPLDQIAKKPEISKVAGVKAPNQKEVEVKQNVIKVDTARKIETKAIVQKAADAKPELLVKKEDKPIEIKTEPIVEKATMSFPKPILYGEEIKYVLTNGKKELLYEASEDDNLDDISKYYNVLPSKIVERNNLKKTKFYEGQKLFIPVSLDVKKIENAIPIVAQNVQTIRKIDSVKTEQKAIAAKSVLSKQAEPLPTIQKATEPIPNLQKAIEVKTAEPKQIEKNIQKPIEVKVEIAAIALPKPNLYGEEIKYVITNGKKELLYEASEDDNLDNISKYYNVLPSKIVERNNLKKTKFYEGQKLFIPVSQDVKKIEINNPIVAQNVQTIRKIDSVKIEQKASAAKSVLSKQAEPLPTIQKAAEPIAVVEKPIETNIVTKKTETAKPSITKDEVKQIVSKKDVVSSAVAKKTIAVNSKKPVDEIAKDSVATVVYSHLVAQDETIEMIAKKYSVSVSDLINWNKLYQTRLRVGQDLIVNNTPKSAAKNTNSEQKDTTANQIKSLKVNKFVEHGLALLQEDNKYKGVLHRTAPVGTYIFLENAENFKKVFIRVTGNLENDNKDVILRIDDETARKVGINNPYTNVILQYSVID